MDFLTNHLLSVITYTPLAGALLLLLPFFKGKDDAVRWFANGVGLLGFLVSLPLWFAFDRQGPLFQFRESASWIEAIGVRYEFGVDGIALSDDPATQPESIEIGNGVEAVRREQRAGPDQ